MAVHEVMTGPDVASSSRDRGRFGPFRALSHRNYRLFFLGQLVSLTGSWIQLAAVMWLAYHLTGTSVWPARIAAAQMLPAFLFGAWGGVLADRVDRRRLVFFTQSALAALAFLLAYLVWTREESVRLLEVICFAIGLVNAVDIPARLAFLVDMTGKDDLVNAVGLNSLTFNVARAAGPALALLLLPLGGPELCFLLNGLSFVAVLAALAAMRIDCCTARREPSGGWDCLRRGFRYVAGHPILGVLLPLTIVVAVLGWPILALLPALADRRLGAGDSGYNSLLSLFGVGALCGAFVVAALGSFARFRLFIATGVVLASSSLIGLSFATTLTFAQVCAATAGCGMILFFATSQSVFQLGAADENRGRVMGIYSIVLTGANPLGNLLTGPAADRWGESVVLRAQGIAILALASAALYMRLVTSRRVVPPPALPSVDEIRPARAA